MLAKCATCDITPLNRPVRLAGYAARAEPVSTILDPIEISALLLETPGQRCLIFSFDLMIVGSELQDMILGRLAGHGFAPREIVLLASHTHFAPATDLACAPLGRPEGGFVNEVAEAAEGLVLRMLREPPSAARLELLQGQLSHSINRRRYWPFPTLGRTYGFRLRSVSMAPDPAGPTDERATVLLLRKPDSGEVVAVIWHYTCHPTAVVPDKVVSADYPGAVRRALRQRFGPIPCVFVQGFCGDVSPNKRPPDQRAGFRQGLRRIARTIMSGPTFPAASVEEWKRWSEQLAARVVEIATGAPGHISSPAKLAVGSASIPLGAFFKGSTPDKSLTVRIVRLGEAIELVAVSAEVTVEWERILDQEIPVEGGRIRLYAGYLGALFGYLPTPPQIRQGGYEVQGFQPLFGLCGDFDEERIIPAIAGCVQQAFDELERTG